jgi:hypothetical protein
MPSGDGVVREEKIWQTELGEKEAADKFFHARSTFSPKVIAPYPTQLQKIAPCAFPVA